MTCPNPAVLKVYWPGRDPIPVCTDHAAKAQRIASAMGLYVAIETGATGTCEQVVEDRS